MKGRKKLPTAIKELQGTLQRCRVMDDEMQPQPLPDYPLPAEWLSEYGKMEWHNVVGGLHAIGMLARLDLSILAMYCNEISVYREMEEKLRNNDRAIAIKDANGNLKSVNVVAYQRIADRALEKALRIASEFGFTPSARTRISMTATNKTAQEYEEFDIV